MNVMSISLSPLGQAALNYAKQRFAVFPLRPRGKEPLTKRGFKDATDDEDQIRRLWMQSPNANIGLPTGHGNRIIVVDLDGAEGERLLARVEKKFGKLPPTAEATTGRGRHLFFHLPEGCGAVPNSQGDGLDIRADGGYVVAPPSIHPNGKTYEWDEASTQQFAEATRGLLDFARNREGVLKALDGPAAAEGGSEGKGKGNDRRGPS